MTRAFQQAVKIINTGAAVRDKDNTTDIPGSPDVVDARADLWQLNVQQQVLDVDGAVVADWGAIFEPGSPLTTTSEVRVVASNALFRVHGLPEQQSSLLTGEVVQIEARLKFISDQQGAPS